jgi:hypothetical protein
MAKDPIKETIKTTHKLDVEGTLDIDTMMIQPEDMDEIPLSKLMKKFNGEFVKITVTNVTESEVPEDEE